MTLCRLLERIVYREDIVALRDQASTQVRSNEARPPVPRSAEIP